MNPYGALKLINYVLFSHHGRGHGIHSPFVFNLISNVFRNKTDPAIVLTLENIRKKKLSDNRTLTVLDLGAGSSRMKTDTRKVSEIARYSSVPPKYGIFLSNMAAEFGNTVIVEFGTSIGISTMYLASGCPEAVVYTMEGCPETAGIARESFNEAGLSNIKLLQGSFDELLPGIKGMDFKPGLVFIDGNHREEPLLKYFSEMAEISDDKTVIIVDDIHTSSEMERAWEKIKKHDNVSFTVDIFRMGIIFFRKGINHNDYIIRY
jgi:predicted O-methyltransferase YrrM